jgi:carboxyl-terminal processing protease
MMMRKTSLILLGAAAGVAVVTLIATPPRIVLDGARAQAAAADTYRQLSLFGDVFERVRASPAQTLPPPLLKPNGDL